MTVRKSLTVGEAARILHTKIANDLKSAMVEGSSVKFKNRESESTTCFRTGT